MLRCSNCNARLSDETTVCPSCTERSAAGRQSRHPSGRQTQAGQSGQHRPGQGSPSGQSGQRRQSPGRSQPRTGGQSRRTVLKYGGAAVLGICGLAVLAGGGGPAGTTRQFFEVLNNGNTDRAERLLHEDSSAVVDGVYADGFEDSAVAVENVSVEENDGDEAIVEATLGAAGLDAIDVEETTHDVGLRTEAGQWRVWSYLGEPEF